MFRTSAIDINNHYWIIGGSTTDVYSSATNTKVPVADQGYVDWSANNTASPIASDAELAEVLQSYGSPLPAWLLAAQPTFIQPTPTTYTIGQLLAYSADARYRKTIGGITVGGRPFATDPVTQADLNSAYIYVQNNPSQVYQWKLPDGTWMTMDATAIQATQGHVIDFRQKCFTCENTSDGSINGGTMTTLAEVDAAYAAISIAY